MQLRYLACAFVGCAALSTAQAQEQATWQWRAGIHSLAVKSNNNPLLSFGDATTLTFDVTYLPIPNFGLELLGALPFTHDISLNGGGKAAQVRQLPPTMTFQYRLFPEAQIRPYLGLGVNYTLFYHEQTVGALRGNKLQLKDSFGTTVQLGMDIGLGADWFLNFDARWLDIESRAKLNATDLGRVQIDPYAVGFSIGRTF